MAEKEQGLTLEDLDNHVEDLYEAMSLDDWMAPVRVAVWQRKYYLKLA